MEEKIRARLLARLDIEGEISDERLFEMIDEEIIREGRTGGPSPGPAALFEKDPVQQPEASGHPSGIP